MSKDKVLGKAKISRNFQIALIREILPFLEVQPGDHVQFRLVNSEVVIEKAQKEKEA